MRFFLLKINGIHYLRTFGQEMSFSTQKNDICKLNNAKKKYFSEIVEKSGKGFFFSKTLFNFVL